MVLREHFEQRKIEATYGSFRSLVPLRTPSGPQQTESELESELLEQLAFAPFVYDLLTQPVIRYEVGGDPTPHFRRRWRLAFVTACAKHGSMLRDGCPACGEPLHQHATASPQRCAACDENLCAPTAAVARHDHLTWQSELETSLTSGWTMLGSEPVLSHVHFAIVRQVAALLVNGKHAARLRESTVQAWGGDPAPFSKPTVRQPIEYLNVAERHRLFDLVERLMCGWPHRFIHACHEAGVRKSHAIKDMSNPPFAYEREMRAYLDATPYYASEPEVAAAATWLRRTQGKASYAALKAICGESRAAIYRHMDYRRVQTRPSKWRVEAMTTSSRVQRGT